MFVFELFQSECLTLFVVFTKLELIMRFFLDWLYLFALQGNYRIFTSPYVKKIAPAACERLEPKIVYPEIERHHSAT